MILTKGLYRDAYHLIRRNVLDKNNSLLLCLHGSEVETVEETKEIHFYLVNDNEHTECFFVVDVDRYYKAYKHESLPDVYAFRIDPNSFEEVFYGTIGRN
jgi:hypothetical protein